VKTGSGAWESSVVRVAVVEAGSATWVSLTVKAGFTVVVAGEEAGSVVNAVPEAKTADIKRREIRLFAIRFPIDASYRYRNLFITKIGDFSPLLPRAPNFNKNFPLFYNYSVKKPLYLCF
jgi:hypothetical protein